jgi:hypothetical protein
VKSKKGGEGLKNLQYDGKVFKPSLRAKRSNLGFTVINNNEIAASLKIAPRNDVLEYFQ